MKLKNTLALSLAAVMAAGLTACGSGADTASAASPAADSTAAESTEAAADTTAAPDGDGEGVVDRVCAGEVGQRAEHTGGYQQQGAAQGQQGFDAVPCFHGFSSCIK